MTSSGEMSAYDEYYASDYSEELGMDYPRIEYPKEVYDRVCGRLPVKRLAKKQKAKDRLYESESSQTDTSSGSDVSSRDRRKKNKRSSQANKSKKLPAVEKKKMMTSKKDVRKPKKPKRGGNYVEDTDEENSDETDTDEDEYSTDSSEVDSPPEKKKRRSILVAKTQRVRSLNEKEGRRRKEIWKGAVQKSKPTAKDDQAIETKVMKERKTMGGKSEKKDDSSMKDKQKKQIEANLDKDRRNDKKEKKKTMYVGSDKKESSGKKLLMKAKKSTESTDSSQEALLNAKQKDNRSKSTVPSTSQPAAVLPYPKSILKKTAPSMTYSSDNSVLPSCLLHLFKEGPAPAAPAAPSASLAAFRMPKKKNDDDSMQNDTSASRSVKKVAASPPVVQGQEESAGGARSRWDPRNESFVPPARTYAKPSATKTVMGAEERRKPSDVQRPMDRMPYVSATPSKSCPSLNSNERSGRERDEPWRKTAPHPVPPPPYSTISPNESARALVGILKKPENRTHGGPSSSRLDNSTHGGSSSSLESILSMSLADPLPRQERPRMANGGTAASALSPMDSYHPFPTPKSAERREAGGAEMRQSIYSGWDSTESPESTRERKSRWNECTPPSGAESRGDSPLSVNTPTSPPQFATSGAFGRPFVETPLPILIPNETEGRVRYRLILIDDEYLPSWNKSARWLPTSALYAASTPVQRCLAILVAGPFPETADKQQFEKLIKSKGADVEWTEAPATKDQAAMGLRSIAAIICYSETTAKSLIEEQTAMGLSETIPIGRPLEVLLSVDGITDEFDQKELMMEMTDVLETNIGPLVELLIFAPPRDFVLKGKARFFYAVHGTRAAHSAALPLGGGRSISLAPCPPDKSTKWITEVFRESPRNETKEEPKKVLIVKEEPKEEEETKKPEEEVMARPRYTRTPLLPTPSIVPTPYAAPQRVSSFKIGSSTTVSAPHQSFAMSDTSMYSGGSRFGALPKTAAIPPPGLVDPVALRLLSKANASSLPAPTTPTFPSLMSIPLPMDPVPVPAPVIPAPIHMVPVLPHPDLPPIQHHFFPPAQKTRADPRRKSGGADGGQRTVDPATFLEPFKALLPKKDIKAEPVDPTTFIKPFKALLPKKDIKMEPVEDNEQDSVLLFARPVDDQPTDWDAVREYFRDNDCSSIVYGGVLSLRYTGACAREKAQLVIVQAPHIVNNQELAIGMTHSVVFEANKAVGKTRLYDELMEKFGAVVEVEKKCDVSGKPAYKIYFSELDKARAAAIDGLTMGEITLTNIGRVPT